MQYILYSDFKTQSKDLGDCQTGDIPRLLIRRTNLVKKSIWNYVSFFFGYTKCGNDNIAKARLIWFPAFTRVIVVRPYFTAEINLIKEICDEVFLNFSFEETRSFVLKLWKFLAVSILAANHGISKVCCSTQMLCTYSITLASGLFQILYPDWLLRCYVGILSL